MEHFVKFMPYVWTGLIMLFVLLEGLTLGLTSIWFAFASVAALLLSLAHVSLTIQIVMFSVLSLVFVLYTRPIAKKYLKVGQTKTNVDAIIGQSGILTEAITPYATGQVKVNGQIWTAVSIDNENLDKDVQVEVVKVEGVKLIVKKLSNDA